MMVGAVFASEMKFSVFFDGLFEWNSCFSERVYAQNIYYNVLNCSNCNVKFTSQHSEVGVTIFGSFCFSILSVFRLFRFFDIFFDILQREKGSTTLWPFRVFLLLVCFGLRLSRVPRSYLHFQVFGRRIFVYKYL